MTSLQGKTLFITGASRGIGKAIALKAAKDGANIVVAAKTTEPHPKLPGTIYSAAEEIVQAGGKSLACVVDVRFEESIETAMKQTVDLFGGIDIVINNASAIMLMGTENLETKRLDLMHQVNTRGTFLCSKLAIPYLRKSSNPHVLTISPPLTMDPKWFQNYVAYTISKYGMSMCTFGMAEEFRGEGIAFNSLWPKTTIATSAVKYQFSGESIVPFSRTPEIMADAAHALLCKNSKEVTGNFFLDEDILRGEGIQDFRHYQVNPELDESQLLPDLFL